MKKKSLNNIVTIPRVCMLSFTLVLFSLIIFSFTTNTINEEFLKQLGITKTEADKKITNSILGGFLNAYGVKNAVNLAAGIRVKVAKDLLAYTKQYTNSENFKKEYATLKENNKPRENKIQTPEQFSKETIDTYKKSVTDAEGYLKNATKDTRAVFEQLVVDSKKLLKDAEDPKNKQLALYTKNYPELLKMTQQSNSQALQEWDAKYPANPLLFVKKRLQQFLEVTKDIDFAAQLTESNGKKYFVNKDYEHKSSQWKMAFRAGKEVIMPAREMVQQWIDEIR